jgi:hypothetical protein
MAKHLTRCATVKDNRTQFDQEYKSRKTSKSTIHLELDVNRELGEDGDLDIDDIDQPQPGRTPSLLCGLTNIRLVNWRLHQIILVIDQVLRRCAEVSYEYVHSEIKVSVMVWVRVMVR